MSQIRVLKREIISMQGRKDNSKRGRSERLTFKAVTLVIFRQKRALVQSIGM